MTDGPNTFKNSSLKKGKLLSSRDVLVDNTSRLEVQKAKLVQKKSPNGDDENSKGA